MMTTILIQKENRNIFQNISLITEMTTVISIKTWYLMIRLMDCTVLIISLLVTIYYMSLRSQRDSCRLPINKWR